MPLREMVNAMEALNEDKQKHTFNGARPNTCLVREKDDTFIPFKVDKLVCINPLSIEEFKRATKDKEDMFNIIIDNRLTYIILMSFLHNGLDVLIYDPYKLTVSSIIEYFTTTMYVEAAAMSIEELRLYSIAMLVIKYGVPHLRIRWASEEVIRAIQKRKNPAEHWGAACALLSICGVHKFVQTDANELLTFIKNAEEYKDVKRMTETTTYDKFYSMLCMIIESY